MDHDRTRLLKVSGCTLLCAALLAPGGTALAGPPKGEVATISMVEVKLVDSATGKGKQAHVSFELTIHRDVKELNSKLSAEGWYVEVKGDCSLNRERNLKRVEVLKGIFAELKPGQSKRAEVDVFDKEPLTFSPKKCGFTFTMERQSAGFGRLIDSYCYQNGKLSKKRC